ncbi:MAG: hypothetical protein CSA26_10605 [Desulfobacterales bacterium]|nr:MAG: hypothetical protein CSA26_10605 [Desulfobacterales bacterium]
MLSPADLFDLEDFPENDIFSNCIYAWDALKQLKEYTAERAGSAFNHRCIADGVPLDSPYILHHGRIRNARECIISYGDATKGKLIVTENGQPLEGASVIMAGATIVGVGHTTEVKHSIFLNDAKAGHFAYLGDSILGNNVNLGAGTKFANLRFVPGNVNIRVDGKNIASGLRKIGAILGDNAQTGCNSVTNPGTIIGKKCMLMPNTTAPSGYHPPGSLIK